MEQQTLSVDSETATQPVSTCVSAGHVHFDAAITYLAPVTYSTVTA